MDKQYIISFLATIKGDKMVVQGMKNIERTQGKVTKTTQKASKATQTYGQMMGSLAKRALMVIPIWLLLRSAFMGVIRTIGDMVKGYLDLEDALARIQTVVHGTTQEIASDMARIKILIKDVAVNTRVPLKELAETFYFLRTSSLTTAEAMSAFEHTVDAMTGTGIKGKEMARAVAGVYNTMGKYILEGASASEKFQRITDVLTYTYATQDVQMDELVQGYTKLAPYISGLSDSFTDLVTIIGFLNTRMLRAGRTGRLTGRTILQISKNADKLASTFGITFAPDQPINFLDTMEQINATMKTQGKLTFEQSQALQQIFATRGAVAPRLILESFEGLREDIEKANKEIEGFTKRIAELKMDTVRGQTERMSNIMKILFEDFITATQGTGDFVEAIKQLADALEDIRPTAQAVGDIFGYIGYTLGQLRTWMETSRKDLGKIELRFFTPGQYVEHMVKLEEKLREAKKKTKKELASLDQDDQENQDDLLAGDKLRVEELKNEITLMKILGATATEIARFRLESLEMERAFMTGADYRVQRQIRLNALIQEEVKRKEEVKKVMQNLYIEYLKAGQAQDKESQERTRNLMEALTFEPKTMEIWWRTATDEWREMIIENWALLTETQQEALREYWKATGQVPYVDISPVSILSQKFAEDIPTTFSENWLEKMTSATDKFRERFLGTMEGITVNAGAGQPLSAEQQRKESDRLVATVNAQMAEYERLTKAGHLPKGIAGKEKWVRPEITIERIEVTAEGVTPEELADAIKEKVKERLESDETIRKIRPKL